jgi:hypothetical protein
MIQQTDKIIAIFVPRLHNNIRPLIEGLLELNFQVSVLALREGAVEDHSRITYIKLKRYSMFGKKYHNHENIRKFEFPSLSELYRFMLEHKPQLMIIRNDLTIAYLPIFILAKLYRSKVILYNQYPKNNPKHYQNLYNKFFFIFFNTKTITPVVNRIYPVANELIFESEKQYEHRIKNNLKYDSVKSSTIWFPFVSNILNTNQTRVTNEIVKVFTVGKMQSRKNLHRVIIFLSDYVLKNEILVELIVAGEYSDGQKMYLSYLNNLKNLAPQNLKIKIITNINSKDIKNIFLDTDIFLLLSESEVASVSQLDAFISGCKILVFHENGNLDFLPIDPLYQKIYAWSEFECKFDKILKLNKNELRVLKYVEVYNESCGGSNAIHRLLNIIND